MTVHDTPRCTLYHHPSKTLECVQVLLIPNNNNVLVYGIQTTLQQYQQESEEKLE